MVQLQRPVASRLRDELGPVLREKVCDLQTVRHRCSQGASPSPHPVPILNLGLPFHKGD